MMPAYHITWFPNPEWKPSSFWLTMVCASLSAWEFFQKTPVYLACDYATRELYERIGLLSFYSKVVILDDPDPKIDRKVCWASRKIEALDQLTRFRWDGGIQILDNDCILRAPLRYEPDLTVQGLHWDPLCNSIYKPLDRHLQKFCAWPDFPLGVPSINCAVLVVWNEAVFREWIARALQFMREYSALEDKRFGDPNPDIAIEDAMCFAEQKLLAVACAYHLQRYGVFESISDKQNFIVNPEKVLHIGSMKRRCENDRHFGEAMIHDLTQRIKQQNAKLEGLCRQVL